MLKRVGSLVLLATFLVVIQTSTANAESANLSWALPTTLSNRISSTEYDCGTPGNPIPETTAIISRLEWRVIGTTEWLSGETENRINTYTIENLAVDTTYEVRVGCHVGDGIIGCWSDLLQFTIGSESPGKPSLQIKSVL